MEHINVAVGVNLMRKLNLLLPDSSLLTAYKCFIRSHLDYKDVIYHHLNLSSLANMIELVHCNAALAITSVIRGTSKKIVPGVRF